MRGGSLCCLLPRWCSGRRAICLGRAALCARGRRPARSPSAPRAYGSARRLEARPGPATAHGHRSQALRSLRRPPHQWGWGADVWLGASPRGPPWPCRRRPAPRPGRRGYCASSTFACNSFVTISVFELASLELQRFWALLNVHAIELHAEFLLCVSVVTRGQWSLVQRLPRMLRMWIGCCYLDRL